MTLSTRSLYCFQWQIFRGLFPPWLMAWSLAKGKFFSALSRGTLSRKQKLPSFLVVSKHSAYHHGEQGLASTIIRMAQDYVGSNNINLLQPNGQFGTRNYVRWTCLMCHSVKLNLVQYAFLVLILLSHFEFQMKNLLLGFGV